MVKVRIEIEVDLDLVKKTGPDTEGWAKAFEVSGEGWDWDDVACAIAFDSLSAGNFTEYIAPSLATKFSTGDLKTGGTVHVKWWCGKHNVELQGDPEYFPMKDVEGESRDWVIDFSGMYCPERTDWNDPGACGSDEGEWTVSFQIEE